MTTETLSVIGDTYKIVLDAKFDLGQAGLDRSQIHCEAFEAGYRKAAGKLAAELGIDITVICGNYEGPQMLEQTSNGDEGEVWQQVHNRTQPARISIEIYADGVYAGQGTLTRDNEIVCDAAIGGDAYEAIADAIAEDDTDCEVDGVKYTWELTVQA